MKNLGVFKDLVGFRKIYPQHFAIMNGKITAEELQETVTAYPEIVHIKDYLGRTLLYCAVEERNFSLVKLLVEENSDLNTQRDLGYTLLHSLSYGNLTTTKKDADLAEEEEIMKYLISKGAKLDITNEKGETPLDIARKWGCKSLEKILIEAAAEGRQNKISVEQVQTIDTPTNLPRVLTQANDVGAKR